MGENGRHDGRGGRGRSNATALAVIAVASAVACAAFFLWDGARTEGVARTAGDGPGAPAGEGEGGGAAGREGDKQGNKAGPGVAGGAAPGAGAGGAGSGEGGGGANGADPAPSSAEGRRAALAGAALGRSLASAFSQRRSRQEVEKALEAEGYLLEREPVVSGPTGARSHTVFTGGPASLAHGRLDWSGDDASGLKLEHVRLVAEESKSDFETLRDAYAADLPAQGFALADRTGPDGALVWKNAAQVRMLVLARHDERVPHPYEGLPTRVSIVTLHEDVHAHDEGP